MPIYFVSEALSGAKLAHSELENISNALVMASRKHIKSRLSPTNPYSTCSKTVKFRTELENRQLSYLNISLTSRGEVP